MERNHYIHIHQDQAFERYKNGVTFQKDIEKIYNEFDYKKKRPDLLGKTVIVTKKQFPKINQMIEELSTIAKIKTPHIYVYEDYYYRIDSYGIDEKWIEISAKTIQDLSEMELKFLLSREIFGIADGVTYHKTILEQRIKIAQYVPVPKIDEVIKLSFYHWYRLCNYSADNFGYAMCKDINAAIHAVLKLVLNSVTLAEEINLNEFIAQAAEINKLDDAIFNYTKADESVPYAPFRIKNLIAYTLSERGLQAIQK